MLPHPAVVAAIWLRTLRVSLSRGSNDGDTIAESRTPGVVWYQEVFINTAATALVSVGVGNGTSATRTSIVQNEGQLTVGNPSAATDSVALTQINFQPTANVGGAELYVRPVLSSNTDANPFQDITHRLQRLHWYVLRISFRRIIVA